LFFEVFIINIKISILSTLAISVIGLVNPMNSFAQGVKPAAAKTTVTINSKKKAPVAKNPNFKNFIQKHNPGLQKTVVDKIAVNVDKYSKENKVDPKLLLALIAKESSFRVNAVSPVGAMGLGQLMSGTAAEVGVKNPFNLVENIKGTARYLRKLLNFFGGNEDITLASYNMGPGAVKSSVNSGRRLPSSVYQYVAQIKNFKSTIKG
jgi:soluble lytic murein transglycosylase-like protein